MGGKTASEQAHPLSFLAAFHPSWGKLVNGFDRPPYTPLTTAPIWARGGVNKKARGMRIDYFCIKIYELEIFHWFVERFATICFPIRIQLGFPHHPENNKKNNQFSKMIHL